MTLEKLDDREVIVTIDSVFLRLCRQTGHIRERPSPASSCNVFLPGGY